MAFLAFAVVGLSIIWLLVWCGGTAGRYVLTGPVERLTIRVLGN